MTQKSRAVEARLSRIERDLLNVSRRLNSAIQKEDAGDCDASAIVAAMLTKERALIEQAAALRPLSKAGLASKGRIVGRHFEISGVGRAVLRSLVEDLHAAEWDSRR